jgi:thymidylate synthase (FAD)
MNVADINVELITYCGTDITIVNAARVSFNKESNYELSDNGYKVFTDKDTKLLNYLAKHKHLSPFNHAFMSFRVKAPIFVARQLVKHKFMPWNEVSRRYVDAEPEFYMPDIRKRAESVKQGSSDDLVEPEKLNGLDVHIADALAQYNYLIRIGACPEQARMVLPQNTMTEWIWSGTLGAFCDMLTLRLKPDTQKETREVAQKVAYIVEELFPESYKARMTYGN